MGVTQADSLSGSPNLDKASITSTRGKKTTCRTHRIRGENEKGLNKRTPHKVNYDGKQDKKEPRPTRSDHGLSPCLALPPHCHWLLRWSVNLPKPQLCPLIPTSIIPAGQHNQ